MARNLLVAVFAFFAVLGWTSAGLIPEEVMDFIDSEDLANIEYFNGLSLGEEVNLPETKFHPQNCVPYIGTAYGVAVQTRTLIQKYREVGKKFYEGVAKCKALTTPEEKKECFKRLMEETSAEAKPLHDQLKKLAPKIRSSMRTFDKCIV